ncbi:MAG: NAD(P)/FAD-dependent oxidoreductase [Actinomycetota bacterium]|nr:NAD(P)/FAD-dependent oxidoreductase [Actinomycetota bacterium]
MSKPFDVIVIGGGPAGLAAATMLGRVRRRVLLVDDEGGGRNEPAPAVHGYLGHDDTSPHELRVIAQRQLERYPSVTVRGERAVSVSVNDGEVSVGFDGGREERARKVLLATGVVDILPEIDGLTDFWGKTVVHCAYCHGWELRDQPLAALVLRPADVMSALQLIALSDDVVVCLHGMDELPPDQQDRLGRVGPTTYREKITRLEGADGRLERIVFADGTAVERSGLFLHPSTRQTAPFARDLGCRMMDDDAVEVDETCRTSVANVFAAGDMACRHTMSEAGHQVSVAAAEGAIAAIALDQELLEEDLER